MTVYETGYQIRLPSHHSSEVFFNEEIFEVVSEAAFQSNEGAVHVLTDWQEAVDSYVMYSPSLYVPCKVQSPTNHIGNNDYYVEYYLHQVFLALNLSSPGCCTFCGTTINRDNSPDIFSKNLELRGYAGKPFALSSGNSWPGVSSIPLFNTWNWLQALNPNIQQVAQTKVERALFAMLCVGKESSLNPNRLMWLAHALEALFDTPDLGISKALKDRIFLVLGKPVTHSKKIRQSIDSFYHLRSNFVHGELAIAHPLGNPSLHEEIAGLEARIMEETDLAISIIWATLQLFVRKNWREIEFNESFSGLPF